MCPGKQVGMHTKHGPVWGKQKMPQGLRAMFYSFFDQKHLVVASTCHPSLSEGRMVT